VGGFLDQQNALLPSQEGLCSMELYIFQVFIIVCYYQLVIHEIERMNRFIPDGYTRTATLYFTVRKYRFQTYFLNAADGTHILGLNLLLPKNCVDILFNTLIIEVKKFCIASIIPGFESDFFRGPIILQ
jgi:hypothetical protein